MKKLDRIEAGDLEAMLVAATNPLLVEMRTMEKVLLAFDGAKAFWDHIDSVGQAANRLGFKPPPCRLDDALVLTAISHAFVAGVLFGREESREKLLNMAQALTGISIGDILVLDHYAVGVVETITGGSDASAVSDAADMVGKKVKAHIHARHPESQQETCIMFIGKPTTNGGVM